MPTIASADRNSRVKLIAAQTEVGRTKSHVFTHRGMKSWSSGSWKTMPTRRRISAKVALLTGSPAISTVPEPACRIPLRCKHQRRLAGAIRAKKGDALPRVDVQVDAEESLVAVRVRVRQPADIDDGPRHESSLSGVRSDFRRRTLLCRPELRRRNRDERVRLGAARDHGARSATVQLRHVRGIRPV